MATAMKRSDESVRLNDYIKAIKDWLSLSKKIGFDIIVAENSNSINQIKKEFSGLENRNLTFIQTGEDQRSHLEGNSAGEFQMLKQISEYGIIPEKTQIIWKATGRLFVKNFGNIILDSQADLILNRFYEPRHLIDTRIIGFSKEQFVNIFSKNPIFTLNLDLNEENRSDKYCSLEEYITFESIRAEIRGKQVKSFKEVPIFEGFSATSNKEIDTKATRMKKRVANLIRPVVIKFLAGSTP